MRRIAAGSLLLGALCALAAGCASAPEQATAPDKIAVYDALPSNHRPYRLVKRLWVTTWRSTFIVPSYGTLEAGKTALQEEAASLGGDAVTDFGCYTLVSAMPLVQPRLICNGNVIKYL
jgi:hypothetical protein